jgi:hypothetical protein
MQLIGKHKNRGGRPAFKPTRRMREQVEIAAAAGMSASDVAVVLRISRPTVEAYFADELKHGRARKFAEILVLLDRAARRGSVGAMKFLFTVVSGGTSTVIGKKEFRQRAAADVLEGGSEWGDDLHPTTEKLQ